MDRGTVRHFTCDRRSLIGDHMRTRRCIVPLVSALLVLGGGVVAEGVASAAPTLVGATHYKNCKALNAKYRHGVGKPGAKDHTSSGHPVTNFKRSSALYAANKSLDRDKDGIACEKR